MKLIEFAFKTHFPTAFLEVIFFVFLKFQFNHTGDFNLQALNGGALHYTNIPMDAMCSKF